MTKSDLYFIVVHIGAFFLGYSAAMIALLHGNPAFAGWFDWSCFHMGLLTAGVTAFGAGLPSTESGKSSLTKFLRLTPEMEIGESIQPSWVKPAEPAPGSDEDAYRNWKSMNKRWVCENNPKDTVVQG